MRIWSEGVDDRRWMRGGGVGACGGLDGSGGLLYPMAFEAPVTKHGRVGFFILGF
jgi:hypothetical protein